MSDQAEKLRQKMMLLSNPLKDIGFVSIMEAQPGAMAALFAFNLAKTFVAVDQLPFILDIENQNLKEEQLSLLLDLSLTAHHQGEALFKGEGLVEREGIFLYLTSLSQDPSHYKNLLKQIGLFIKKQISKRYTPLIVVQSATDIPFVDEIDKASILLLVTKGEPQDLVETYTLVKRIHQVEKELPIGVIVSHVRSVTEAKTAFDTLNAVTTRFLNRSLTWCGGLSGERGASDYLGKGLNGQSIYIKCVELILKRWKASLVEG